MANHILNNDNKTIRNILDRLNDLKELNRLLSKYVDSETSKHCQIIKYEKNCLFVIVDNGNWATQLRFRIPDLMAKLRLHAGLENISGIICKTRPAAGLVKTPKLTTRTVATLSAKTAESLLETAKTIKDPKLRAIIERIAKYS